MSITAEVVLMVTIRIFYIIRVMITIVNRGLLVVLVREEGGYALKDPKPYCLFAARVTFLSHACNYGCTSTMSPVIERDLWPYILTPHG